ncbi:hypothetical protein HJFPF1_04429 [Paramyrothecium foliicola]|nr:hypothetical protein HJFPF1_04429 [Paramyrothecium foliicola]
MTTLGRPQVISSSEELKKFISSITSPSELYVDLEGYQLGRHGTISIITILVHPLGTVGLLDVSTLGASTFNTISEDSKTIKSILEDPDIPKFFWDVRNDADALWGLYEIGLAGVTDLQLFEKASRDYDKTFLCGLDKAVECDLKPSLVDLTRWKTTKTVIKNQMSTNVFSTRPLSDAVIEYCANDVVHLPKLHQIYLKRIRSDWPGKAMDESARRIKESKSAAYKSQSPTKVYGPWPSQAPAYLLESEIPGDLDEEHDWEYDDYDDYYDGPTSCRDIIDICDYALYYSD